MPVSDPGPSSSADTDRHRGLAVDTAETLACAALALADERCADAQHLLDALPCSASAHPEVLRLRSIVAHTRKRFDTAIDLLGRAIAQWPDDALLHSNLGGALVEAGDLPAALRAFRRSAELAPSLAVSWFNLGKTLAMDGAADAALESFARALDCDAHYTPAKLGRALALQVKGRIDEAAAAYRATIAADPASVPAWLGLASISTLRLDDADIAALSKLYARADLRGDERIALGFALAKGFEDVGSYREAFAMLSVANTAKRREIDWDSARFARWIDSIQAAFAKPVTSAADTSLGSEAIFVFGLPRSGSTLTEQILAGHAQVEGANELSDLAQVIEAESQLRGSVFPSWVSVATADDWARLGRAYLERTARWRQRRPRSTDKALGNWKYVGAALSMLPAARFVNVRRDPLETCLACYRQSFASGQRFTYDLDDLAAHWRDYERTARFWQARYPGCVFDLGYEELQTDTETVVRRLLDYLGLPFDPACLHFDRVERDVRTASLAQVRQPMRRDTARASRYGALLDPLKKALSRYSDSL